MVQSFVSVGVSYILVIVFSSAAINSRSYKNLAFSESSEDVAEYKKIGKIANDFIDCFTALLFIHSIQGLVYLAVNK